MRAAAALWLGLWAGGAGTAAAASGPVAGTVVAMHGGRAEPVPGQTVTDGVHTAVTDAAGRFTFPDEPLRYDLTIVDAGRSVVTIYQGLTRRDPILVQAVDLPASGSHHHAVIAGKLIGGAPYRSMHVQFASALASKDVIIGRFGGSGPRGPEYGPIAIDWNGPSPLHGELLALQLGHDDHAPTGGTAWFGRQEISLRDGDVLGVDLKLAELPQLRLPKVSLGMAGEYPLPPAHSYYRTSDGNRLFRGPSFVTFRDSFGPDLVAQGLEFCLEAFIGNPYLRATDVLCRPPPGQAVTLNLRAAPEFSTPAQGAPAAVGLKLAWAEVPGGVYALSLRTTRVARDAPRIQIITTATSAAWPDLHTLEVAFPKAPASYTAIVKAEGPFASVDEAAGPNGFSAVAPRARWSSESQDLGLPVLPPGAPETAACKANGAVVCAAAEVYQLSAMNRRIRFFPEFAKAIGIFCVRTCDDARAFAKAYADYLAAHPGFDAHLPLEPDGPEPRLPPELRRK